MMGDNVPDDRYFNNNRGDIFEALTPSIPLVKFIF